MKTSYGLWLLLLSVTVSLTIRLSHDNRKGYAYSISGASVEEIVEADQKMRQYLKSLAPKKATGPAPSSTAARPVPTKR